MAKKNYKVKSEVIIAGIAALTVIQVVAMMYGINGTLRIMIAIAIAGMCGVAIPKELIFKTK